MRLIIHERPYDVVRLLGRGKGGYSYLTLLQGTPYVVKQIHHEPCDYYTFGNKFEAELRDYQRLQKAGIRIPHLLDCDAESERIVKEYIPGDTIFQLLRRGETVEDFLPQVRQMAAQAQSAGMNIDYFPTNFVVRDHLLWYIDYECNDYQDEWNLENWGIRYWSMTPELKKYLAENP